MRTIVLIIGLAHFALQASPNLSANTDTVSDLDGRYLFTNLDGLTNDFVSDTEWERGFSPAAGDGMDVGTAHTAGLNLDINVTIFEGLCFELENLLLAVDRCDSEIQGF